MIPRPENNFGIHSISVNRWQKMTYGVWRGNEAKGGARRFPALQSMSSGLGSFCREDRQRG